MKNLPELVKKHIIPLILLVILIGLVIAEPALLSFRHFRNILFQAAPLTILAAPLAFCMTRRYFDISFGRCAAFAGVAAASLLQSPDFSSRMFESLPRLPVIAPLLLVMLLGAGLAALNLFCTVKLRLTPVFSGLIFAGFFQGALTLYLARKDENDRVLEHFTKGFIAFGTGYAGINPAYSLPWTVIIALACCAVLAMLSGGKFSGILGRFSRNKTGGFAPLPLAAMAGAFYALGGVMTAAKTSAIDARFMAGVEFSVLAGVLAGGVSLFGGKGSIPGALSGVILCTAVFYMMDFIFPVSGLALLLQTLILGAALALDVRTRSRHHE